MSLSLHLDSPMASRPCRYCLALQDGSVFADWDVDPAGQAFLRRISFDGFGCCEMPENVKSMTPEDSRIFLDSIDRGVITSPNMETILRRYFQANSDVIWRDALTQHELL